MRCASRQRFSIAGPAGRPSHAEIVVAQPVDRCDVRDEQLAESVVTQDGCVLGVDEGAQDYAASLSRARRRSIQNSTMPATTDAPGRAATASR